MARDASRAVVCSGEFQLKWMPTRVKWPRNLTWVGIQLHLGRETPGCSGILARRSYAGILCELWIADDRRVL